MRRGLDAYIDSFRHFRNQKAWDLQINNAFLLGLSWEYLSDLQILCDQEKAINAFQNALKEKISKSIGELEAERVRLEELIEKEDIDVSNFQVHPQYENIQQKANKITEELHNLANTIFFDKKKCSRYQESIAVETTPSDLDLEGLYQEVGVIFPSVVKYSLTEAKEFHSQLVRNRKLFLEAEVTQLKNAIKIRQEKIKQLSEDKASLMKILETHGAIEEFIKIKEIHLLNKQKLEKIKNDIVETKEIAGRKKEIKLKKVELEAKLERDYEQNRIYWEKFVRAFNDNSKALYDEPGDLIINVTEKGYKFDINIQRSNSEGIGRMKIFCYDLTLVEKFGEREGLIDFFIHDSTIFDGVDSRQIALALERTKKVSQLKNIQYICTLNSDVIPYDDLSNDFIFDNYVCLRLTDKDPKDSLLGFRFET